MKTSDTVPDISSLLRQGKLLYRTRTSAAFESTLKQTNKRVLFWRLNFPLPPISKVAVTFSQRIEAIQKSRISVPKILAYGVDDRGIAYVITEYTALRTLLGSTRQAEETSYICHAILKQLSLLHRYNIAVGDISVHSFLLNKKGKICVAAFFGPIDLELGLDPTGSAKEFICYLAPEHRATVQSQQPDPKLADIYAFGAYAFQLITRQQIIYTPWPEKHYEFLNTYLPHMLHSAIGTPVWAEELCRRCLPWKPQDRCQDLNELLTLIKDKTEGHSLGEKLREAIVGSDNDRLYSAWRYLVFYLGAIMCAIFAVFYVSTHAPRREYIEEGSAHIGSIMNEEQSPLFKKGRAAGAHSANGAEQPTIKKSGWKLRLGRGSYDENDIVTARAIALSKEGKKEHSRARQSLARWQSYKTPNAKAPVSTTPLPTPTDSPVPPASILPPVSTRSSYPVRLAKTSLMSRQEADRILRFAHRYPIATVKEAAKQALSDETFSEINRVFLGALVESEEHLLTPDLLSALGTAAVGQPREQDIEILAADQSYLGELTLLAAAATATDPLVLNRCWKQLANRSLIIEPGRSLVALLKQKRIDLPRLAKQVGVLALAELADKQAIQEALSELIPYIYFALPTLTDPENEKFLFDEPSCSN